MGQCMSKGSAPKVSSGVAGTVSLQLYEVINNCMCVYRLSG